MRKLLSICHNSTYRQENNESISKQRWIGLDLPALLDEKLIRHLGHFLTQFVGQRIMLKVSQERVRLSEDLLNVFPVVLEDVCSRSTYKFDTALHRIWIATEIFVVQTSFAVSEGIFNDFPETVVLLHALLDKIEGVNKRLSFVAIGKAFDDALKKHHFEPNIRSLIA
jgi:hypothetical protein